MSAYLGETNVCSYSGGCRCDKCKRKKSIGSARYYTQRRRQDPDWRPTERRIASPNPYALTLRKALSEQDMREVRRILLAGATVTESGCWIWPILNGNGYPSLGKGAGSLHRRVLELKHGALLGVQAAHHICATRACVNPEHLMPVTHRDNTAEMMQRRTYLARIQELEQALRCVAPDHPALKTVPVL